MAKKPKAIGLNKALDLMQLPGTRLVKMHCNASPEGFVHYIVPGGYVEPHTAERIKEQINVTGSKDGLWPGCDQTWRIG